MQTETQHQLAIAEVTPIVADIAAYSDTIESIDVADEEALTDVGDLVKMLMRRRGKLEDKRKSLVGPLNGVVKEINELFKVPRETIDRIVAAGKKKMNRYAQAQQHIEDAKRARERQEAEDERKEAEELAKRLARHDSVSEEVGATVVAQAEKRVEQAAAPAKVAAVKGDAATVVTTKTWKAEVTDMLELAKAVAEGRLPTLVLEPNGDLIEHPVHSIPTRPVGRLLVPVNHHRRTTPTL